MELERQKQAGYRIERSKAGAADAVKRWNAPRSTSKTDSSANGSAIGSANGSAIVLPLANGMARNSSSSSVFVSEKEKHSACSATDTGPSKAEEEQNAKRIWEQIGETEDGRELLKRFGIS